MSASPPALATQKAKETRPNIVFLLTDDQWYDTLGCNGNTIIRNPHLDALSRRAVNFDRAIVTTSICAPIRACILTGQYARHRMWHFDRVLSPRKLARTYPPAEAGRRPHAVHRQVRQRTRPCAAVCRDAPAMIRISSCSIATPAF
jgi:arylsulfatase A-like enzyme